MRSRPETVLGVIREQSCHEAIHRERPNRASGPDGNHWRAAVRSERLQARFGGGCDTKLRMYLL